MLRTCPARTHLRISGGTRQGSAPCCSPWGMWNCPFGLGQAWASHQKCQGADGPLTDRALLSLQCMSWRSGEGTTQARAPA